MKILFLPDDVSASGSSGSFSAGATIRQLSFLGHELIVIDRSRSLPRCDPDGVRYVAPPTDLRWYEHLSSPALVDWFSQICRQFRPDYYLMAGGIQKPAALARAARKDGIRTAFLFYTNDYYCDRIYSGLKDGPCIACAGSPEIPALLKGCVSPSRALHVLKSAIIRAALKTEVLSADRVLCYGEDQAKIYRAYGVRDEAIRIIGFQFDPSDLDGAATRDDGYFAITGQALMQKGFHILSAILSYLNASTRIKISIPNTALVDPIIDRFDLRRHARSGSLTIIAGLRSRAQYLEFLAGSRGVLIPSYYPTTGEFVLQESLYLGKPVHVFNVGVHQDILRDGDNALVSEVGDFEDFAQKISRLDTDQVLRRAIGERARETSLRFYDAEAIKLWDTALS